MTTQKIILGLSLMLCFILIAIPTSSWPSNSTATTAASNVTTTYTPSTTLPETSAPSDTTVTTTTVSDDTPTASPSSTNSPTGLSDDSSDSYSYKFVGTSNALSVGAFLMLIVGLFF
ncbi:4963_t:CDS:2 [Ambispora leptoticha]|uniref:4963_t:CDS:1 n=1 Tax=Ambispora leptoticha TaxID=144679 RepID=A0A9N9A7Z9_9GLOM|nr:4963_t:CDS:2 [Ambispora leptoticha]